MPAAHVFSYDRGFDIGRNLGHAEVSLSPLIAREMVYRPPREIPWRKVAAMAIVGVMVLTGFVILAEALLKSTPTTAEEVQPARPLANEREMTLTINHMFESYLKPTDYSMLGRWGGTMGLNSWFDLRKTGYQEWTARDKYPFVLCYNPYSTATKPDINMGNSITTWYRMYIDAKNITEIGTGSGEDPIFVPVLGGLPGTAPGGWVNISYYGTYLTTQELSDIYAGTHYANTYYGVPDTSLDLTDDGYWHELQGKISFTRDACKKFLGLPGTGNLVSEFNADEATIESDWYDDWVTEGGPGASGIYDTYTAYDYSLEIDWLELMVDPDFADPDTLHLRFWSVSWGNECLLVRYMEHANVARCWQGWNDDWYLNMSIGPSQGNLTSRSVLGYHMYATKDGTNTLGAWSLEAGHLDWCGNLGSHTGYTSPYNAYDPDKTSVTYKSWAPLTVNYGKQVSYALAPLEWDLASGEELIVQLPSGSVIGYNPKASATDVLDDAKIAELAANSYWGELVMGNGYPSSYLKPNYSAATKTLTLTGPINFPSNTNPLFPTILEGGTPSIVLDVAKVSYYELELVGQTKPYNNLVGGTPYTLRVTARNVTDALVTNYNGTTDLSSTDPAVTISEVTHHWVLADAGDYETTITFWTLGTWYVNATDRNYTQDVTGSITVTVTTMIPEFATLAVPVVGAAAIMLLLRARRRKRE